MSIKGIQSHTPIYSASFSGNRVQRTNFLNKNATDSVQFSLHKEETPEVQELKEKLNEIEEKQGFIGKLWSGFKNLTHIGASSNKVDKKIEAYKKGEISLEQAKEAVEKYEKGQKMVVDVIGDMASGVISVIAFTAAVPTGGMSLVAGIGLAAGVGAATKIGIKGTDAISGGRKYSGKDLIYDTATGAINGIFSPVSNGIGASLTKTLGEKMGLTVVKAGTKEVIKGAAKQSVKTIVTQQGVDVIGGTFAKRALATAAGMAVDGAISGATDNMTRAALNGEDIGKAGVQGAVGGLIMAPVIGGSFKLAGKAGRAIGNTIKDKTAKTAAKETAEEAGEALTGRASREIGETLSDKADDSAASSITRLGQNSSEELTESLGESAASTASKETSGETAEVLTIQAEKEVVEETTEKVSRKALDFISRDELESFLDGVEVLYERRKHPFTKVLVDTKGSLKDYLKYRKVKLDTVDYDGFLFLKSLTPESIGQFSEGQLEEILRNGNVCLKNAGFLNELFDKSKGHEIWNLYIGSFISDPDFDSEGALKLIEALSKVKIADKDTERTLLSAIQGCSGGLGEIFNVKGADYEKLIKFVEALQSTTLKVEEGGAEKTLANIFSTFDIQTILKQEKFDFEKSVEIIRALNGIDGYEGFNSASLYSLTKNYDPAKGNIEDYILTHRYFDTLKDANGERIFTGRNGRSCSADVIGHMINIDPSSVEASNAEMLIRLVEEGKVGRHVFEYLPEKGTINAAVVEDIDTLYQALIDRVDPIDAFVPRVKTEEMAKLRIGDVFQLEGDTTMRIKVADETYEALNMSRETYFKLFPPIERYASTQNRIGNCWEITGINTSIIEADTRSAALRTIYEDGDDIIIRFPDSPYSEIRFKNGELPEGVNPAFHSNGAKGVQLLEYADGVEIQQEKINRAIDALKEKSRTSGFFKRMYYEKRLKELMKFISENDGSVEFGMTDKQELTWWRYDGKYKNVTTEARDGGQAQNLWKRLGFKVTEECTSIADNADWVKNPETFKTHLISWSSAGDGIELPVIESLGIVTNHAYRIKPAKLAADGTIETFNLINPWGIIQTELTFDELVKYGKGLRVAHK